MTLITANKNHRSRLSHDFYQVFAGKNDMTLHGWRQLAEWSIDHSCMDDAHRARVKGQWRKLWDEFCRGVVLEHGALIEPNAAPTVKV
jgi:adenosine deaminase CECR1